ncbi:MAG TPA: hypothetical protein VFT22_16855 [Kofleriaceae bacterium]|nr:hypothetical protein [Kofleriaceae bacterium]
MKKKKPQRRQKPKLVLAKESVRKLADPDLPSVVGAAQTNVCATVTFPKCCLTI